MKKALDRDDAAWEAELAASWKESADADATGGAEESAALARRLDGILRAERAARKARRARAWLAWGAAAACAALVALSAVRIAKSGAGTGTEVEVASAATAEEAEDESDVAEARVAPVSEAFGELEDVLTELAALDFRYGWDDEDLEIAD
ncbi:MAG: hypothetical protein IJT88_02000 [Kiritimatiellae bacterium]|nr:hypothetical protein [Kiritimatiellia bacterium]